MRSAVSAPPSPSGPTCSGRSFGHRESSDRLASKGIVLGGGHMGDNGYAKPVLVTTDWLAEHLQDDGLVVAEVDENPDLYDEGHIARAIKLHWREDLQDPIERDLVEKEQFEQLMGSRGVANDTTVVLYGDKNNWFAA